MLPKDCILFIFMGFPLLNDGLAHGVHLDRVSFDVATQSVALHSPCIFFFTGAAWASDRLIEQPCFLTVDTIDLLLNRDLYLRR